MISELLDLTKAYLTGWKTIRDLAEWLSGINWDDPDLDPDSISWVGRLELLATEVLEGLRAEADFWKEASDFVAGRTNFLFIKPFIAERDTADSSNDTTNWYLGLNVLAPVG